MTDLLHVSTARAAYDATAATYSEMVGTEITPAIEASVDRALLGAFVDSVADSGMGPVADVGCGPGRVASFLADGGIHAIGVDVSHAMLAIARIEHPGVAVAQGQLSDLPFRTGSLGGVVSWYSIIHTPPEHLDAVCGELNRVLTPGGHALLAFQSGDGQAVHRSEVYGTTVSLTSYRHSPDDVIDRLGAAAFQLVARTTREPALVHETTPQAFIAARSGRPMA